MSAAANCHKKKAQDDAKRPQPYTPPFAPPAAGDEMADIIGKAKADIIGKAKADIIGKAKADIIGKAKADPKPNDKPPQAQADHWYFKQKAAAAVVTAGKIKEELKTDAQAAIRDKRDRWYITTENDVNEYEMALIRADWPESLFVVSKYTLPATDDRDTKYQIVVWEKTS